MRLVASVIACVGVALALAGCDPVDKRYFREGVGSNLYAVDVAASPERQDEYVATICHQAGLADGACNIDQFSPVTWTQFVQAGMNDIDQRCDAYLTWLDYIRRSRDPTIKQLADMQTTSTVIMGATGVGAAPIAIVAAAVGLATNTFTNVTSRLILEVDHSTVQAVVLSNQKKYREELFGTAAKPPVAVIASKPAAIYALRSYLRLCMPMTIETQINNTIATFSRGGAEALRSEGMISAVSVARPTLDVTRPIEPTKLGSIIGNPMSEFESSIESPRGKLIQRALCVKNASGDFGGVDSETRKNLRAFKAALYAEPIAKQVGIMQTVVERKDVTDAAFTFPSCLRAGFADAFEVGAVYKYGVDEFRKKLARQLKAAKAAGAKVEEALISNIETKSPPKGKAMDGDMRQAIHLLSAHYNISDGGKISAEFYEQLRNRDTL